MSLLAYIRANCRVDGGYLITENEMRALRIERVKIRRLAFRLMREFKHKADILCIRTRWNKPYRAMKAYFQQTKGR